MHENSHCRSHPAQSAVGICSICVKEKLGKLAFCERQPRSEPCEVGSSSPLLDFTTLNNGGNVDVGSVGRISFLIDKDRSNHPGYSDGFGLFGRSKSVAASRRIGSLENSNRCPLETSSKKKASFWSFLYLMKRKNNNKNGVLDEIIVDENCGSQENANANFLSLGRKVTRSRSVGHVRSRSVCGDQHQPIAFSDSAPKALDSHQKTKMKSDEQVKGNVKCVGGFVGLGGVPSSSSGTSTSMISHDLKDGGPRVSGCRRRSRSRSWAFSSPMRVLKQSKRWSIKANHDDNTSAPSPPASLTEIDRG